MTKTLVKGSLIGAVILIAWSTFSWMALPWHMKSFSTMTDEAAVLKSLAAQSPASGIYLVPNMHAKIAAAPREKRKEAEAECKARMKEGPTALVVIHKGGMDMEAAMGPMMLRGLVLSGLACLVVTWILLQAGAASFARRVGIAFAAGTVGAVVTHLSYWNWWWFPDRYTLTEIGDTSIGWLLTGLALAKITGKRGRR